MMKPPPSADTFVFVCSKAAKMAGSSTDPIAGKTAGSSDDPISYTRVTSNDTCPSCMGMERECQAMARDRDALQSAIGEQIAAATAAAKAAAAKADEAAEDAAEKAEGAALRRESAAWQAGAAAQKDEHSRSMCRARLGTFFALVLALLSTASLCFYMLHRAGARALSVPEQVFVGAGLVIGVVAIFYVATLVSAEEYCVIWALWLCDSCSDAMAKARAKVKDCLRKFEQLERTVIPNSVSTLPTTLPTALGTFAGRISGSDARPHQQL